MLIISGSHLPKVASVARGPLLLYSAAASLDDDSQKISIVKKDALLWSRGVAPSLLFWYGAILLLSKSRVIQRGRELVASALLNGAHRIEYWTSLAMISSSCCLLQLILNVFSIGCAGFNRILGPLRPLTLAILLHAQTAVYSVSIDDPISSKLRLTASIASMLVALSPEIVAGINAVQPKKNVPTSANATTVYLPTMGCVACIDAVNRALRRVPGVLDTEINLHENAGGHATVRHDERCNQSALIEACGRAGFPKGTTIESRAIIV